MKKKLIQVLEILLIKFSSVAIMGLIFLYLWINDGFEGVGEFAALMAIIAPIGVFSQFRYIEFISIAENKENAFKISYTSSLIVFTFFISIFLLFVFISGWGLYLYILAILYKYQEMYFEFKNAYSVSLNDRINALRMNALRIVGVFLLFLLDYSIGIDNYLLFAFLFLNFYNFIVIIFNKFDFSSIDLRSSLGYVKDNYYYGISSMLISLNSLIPRYFFIYLGDKKSLGIFTIIYLVSSTSVNLFQYLFSVKSELVFNIVINKSKIIKFLLVSLLPLAFFMLFMVDQYLVLFSSFFLMFIFMLIRGLIITSSVVYGLKSKINYSVILGMILSIILSFLSYIFNSEFLNFSVASFYVVLSSCITSFILIYILNIGKNK